MPLINPQTSVGVNGQAAPSSSNVEGFNNNNAGTQQVSQSTPLPTQDQAVASAQTTDGSLSVFISGDPNGDFAGVNILEQVVTDGTGLFVNTKSTVQNPVKTDANNATVLSDAVGGTITAKVNDITTIDTTGYQSITLSILTYNGTPTISNDGINFVSVFGSQSNNQGLASTISGSNIIYTFPCIARYFRLQCSVAGSFTYYLRNVPFNYSYVNGGQQNINVQSIGQSVVTGAGAVGTLAVGGAVAAGLAPTTNPLIAGGVDSAGLTRRALYDTTGQAQTNVTNQNFNGTIYPEQYKPLRVEQIHSDRGQDSLQDLLQQILVELKTLNYYTREIPNSINLMLQQSTLAGFIPPSMADDPEQFFSDTTLFNLTKGQ